MKYLDFILKSVGLCAILLTLFAYQQVASARAEEMAAHEAAVAEVEAYNAEVEAAILAASQGIDAENDAATGLYIDGIYEGEAMGFGGNIRVSVTVAEGEIASIEVLDASAEDPAYYQQAEAVLDSMIKEQSTEVDTVSGATFSSNGLIGATAQALEQAVD